MSGRYLLQLINDTLDMNKIEAGKLELNLKPINSQAVFGNILANATIMAKTKGIELEIKTPDIADNEWVPVLADSARLEQIILNIVSNAIKFTSKDGKVELIMETVSITENEVTDKYIIRDTGIGISEEFLPHIFEAFAQEGRANTARENGTGLGMSIVKQLVELMGGEISVKSKLNQGTEVTLVMRYPVNHESVNETGETLNDDKQNDILKGKHIFLCEDHPLNAKIAIRLLGKKGIIVEHAENGQIGVEMYKRFESNYYDAVLMDVRMPVMNGLEATEAIRKLEREDSKSVPIIAMTANAYKDDVDNCINAGMTSHIAKPIEPEIMYKVITKCILTNK